MSSKNIIHPQIFSLLSLKDEGRKYMQARKYPEAMDVMYYLNIEMERDDREPELFKKIRRERITLRNFTYPGGITNRIKKMWKMYEQWWDDVIHALITKGYLTNAKYGFDIKTDAIKFE